MSIRLENIRLQLTGASEDARFEAWFQLYSSEDEKARGFLDRLQDEQDAVLKLQFCRFLAQIPEARAIAYLEIFLADSNPLVVAAAQRAFNSSRFDEKLKSLLPLVNRPPLVSQLFAIDKLALGAKAEVVGALLDLLPKAEGKLLLAILSALRHFPEERIFHAVCPFETHENEEMRFRTALVIGGVHRAGYPLARHKLVDLLNDPSPRVRQAVLWALRQKPSRHDKKLLMNLSISDPDPRVRQEALIEFSFFPTREVILHLTQIVATEKDRLVRLKAEGILLSMPPSKLTRHLQSYLQTSTSSLRNKVILLLAHFQKNSSGYLRYLLKGLRHAKTDLEKLPFVEALGFLGRVEALERLEPLLQGSKLLAYTTLTAMIRILRERDVAELLPYLTKVDANPLLLQQVLKELGRRLKGKRLPDLYARHLMKFLPHENLNLRYLASRLLAHADTYEVVEALVQTLHAEQDRLVLRSLLETLGSLWNAHPSYFATALLACASGAKEVGWLVESLQAPDLSPEQVLELVYPALHNSSFLEGAQGGIVADALARLVSKRALPVERLLEKMDGVLGREKVMDEFEKQWRQRLQRQSLLLPLDLLFGWFRDGDEKMKRAVLKLLALTAHRGALSFLSSLIVNEKESVLHDQAARAVNEIMIQAG